MSFARHAMATAISLALSATAFAAGESGQSGTQPMPSDTPASEVQQPAGRTTPELPSEAGAQSGVQQVETGKPLLSKKASELEGMDIENRDGDTIGEIDKVVIDPQTGQLHAVVAVGGVLGVGGKSVTVDIDQLQLHDDKLVAQNIVTEDELKSRPEYVEANYRELEGETVLSDAGAGTSGEGGDRFTSLDADGDGRISREEASQALQENWQRIDANSDEQIDRAEFSAFEEIKAE